MVFRDFVLQLAARLVLFVVGLCSASLILVRFHPDLQHPDVRSPATSAQSTVDIFDADRLQRELRKLLAAVEGSAGTATESILTANSMPFSVGLRGGPDAHDQEGLSQKLAIGNYLAKIAETEVQADNLARYFLVARVMAAANEDEIWVLDNRMRASKITTPPVDPFIKGSELYKPSIWSTFLFLEEIEAQENACMACRARGTTCRVTSNCTPVLLRYPYTVRCRSKSRKTTFVEAMLCQPANAPGCVNSNVGPVEAFPGSFHSRC